jgi:putative membrane protein
LRLLTGDAFDRQYMTRISINDNERTVEMLQKAQKSATDTGLRDLLARQLAMAESHLTIARKLNGQKSG